MIIRPATPADAAGIARVHVDTWRTTYAGIVPAEFLAHMSYEEGQQRWVSRLSDTQNATFVFVAEDEQGQIVGFVSGGPNRNDEPLYQSELYAIYILQAYHGRGLGQQLTVALVEKLLQMGMNSMILWVFATNPARHFYEALGGQLVKASQFEISGAIIDEVAYGWLDIRTILRVARS